MDDGNTAPPPPVQSDAEPASGAAAARAMFQNKSSRGQDKGAAGAQRVSASQHTRAITGISVQSGKQTIVTTASLDGKIIVWDLHSTMLSIGAATMNLA